MSFPLVLLQPGARNESQDTELTTIKLTPNAHSNFQTRFVIPRQGSILDSNSALIWNIEWDGFSTTAGYLASEYVTLKQKSGGLPTLQRARFFIGGREIFTTEDAGHLIHIKHLQRNPDYLEEMIDKEIGSSHGYHCVGDGKYQPGPDARADGELRYSRRLGSGTKAIQCSVLLSDLFSALESLQLPMALDEMRVEIDWNTSFDEVATAWVTGDGNGDTRDWDGVAQTISIKEPRLLLDYLTFNEELRAGLGEVLQSGMVLPYVHTSMSSKTLPENSTATARTDDVHLALQGKLLMKMYVSHRFSDSINNAVTPYAQVQGRCRSQRGLDMSYNLFINDIAIHDLPVKSASQAYSFLSMAAQNPVSVQPGFYEYNADYGAAVAATQVIAPTVVQSGITLPTAVPANSVVLLTDGTETTEKEAIRDGQAGTQSYLGFDLAKYDEGSRVVPANAGYRVGSSAVILRLTQTGAVGAESPARLPKTVQVFTEEVRVLQVRGGVVDSMEA